MKTSEILTALAADKEAHGYLTISELRSGTGWKDNREIDLFSIHPWPSHKYHRMAFEIKVSLGDLARELKDPNKRDPFVKFANEFYFVTPVGLIKDPDKKLPADCGLIEFDGAAFKVILEAEYQEFPPSWGLVASVIRSLNVKASREP
jgi:hypothetical protein